jgi:hypothetical protein
MNYLHRFNIFANKHLTAFLGLIIFFVAFSSYAATVPPAQVPGDPSEYTFIPWILGIAHPPGYGFYTLLAAVWQHLLPIGSVAYRTHLLAATAGACSATLVYASVQRLTMSRHISGSPVSKFEAHLPAVFAGLSFTAATDVWQHSIHANAHIITLLLATSSIFLLIEWWNTGSDRWLYFFALIAGISPAHHPLLVFAFPAYLIFILIVRPRIFLQPKKLLGLIGMAALGLSVFLYYPLRSPTTPFGVNDIHSWDTFFHFVSAEGLRVNLFHFGWADQPTRFSVFVDLLGLQYPSISILLAIPGFIWLARRAIKPFVLCALFFGLMYAFIINTVQDVMAYLLLPFMMMAIFIGVGVWAVSLAFVRSARLRRLFPIPIALALLLPINTLAYTAPRVSLKNFTLGSDWVNTVFDRFAGTGEHAALLAPWEAMTPLWVAQYVEGRTLDPKDVTPVYVTTGSANPWLDNVFAHLDAGPVYLADYRPQVVEGKLFRLRPEGNWPLWRVAKPGDTSVPPLDHVLNVSAGGIELIGYSIDRTTIEAGQSAHLTLALRSAVTPTHIIMPYALIGDRRYAWTTDSRLLTPDWLPDEVIVERYELTLPFNTSLDQYPLKLGFSDLSADRDLNFADGAATVELGSLQVVEPTRPHIESAQDELADFNAQIALIGASANGNGQSVTVRSSTGPNSAQPETLQVRPGQPIQVWLNWLAEQQVDESYTVFVHLIDGSNRLYAQQDYTPMGGAFPTFLWIPKWIEGQIVNDPYQLELPANLPPGDYWIEAGLYGMTSGRRAVIIGRDGSLAGDRTILFKVSVQP